MPYGTPDQVRAEVAHMLGTLGRDGTGYILTSSSRLQPDTPVENILAMYEAAGAMGRYPPPGRATAGLLLAPEFQPDAVRPSNHLPERHVLSLRVPHVRERPDLVHVRLPVGQALL